ncbi:MAG: hypothetical protein IT210_09375 [Armatimonadetes bacterium]|nr:hypothetical protein [Armatimonadota bacterium]
MRAFWTVLLIALILVGLCYIEFSNMHATDFNVPLLGAYQVYLWEVIAVSLVAGMLIALLLVAMLQPPSPDKLMARVQAAVEEHDLRLKQLESELTALNGQLPLSSSPADMASLPADKP